MFSECILRAGHYAERSLHEWSPSTQLFQSGQAGLRVVTNTPQTSVVYYDKAYSSLFYMSTACRWGLYSTPSSLWDPTTQAANIWNIAFVAEDKKVLEDLTSSIQ